VPRTILAPPVSKGTLTSDLRFLASDLNDPSTLTIVSSDFCHWGSRFSYTHYLPPSPLPPTPISLSSSVPPHPNHPIHVSIELLDREALEILQSGGKGGTSWPAVHEAWDKYLKRTHNTICGRHPIGVLLGAMASGMTADDGEASFVHYEQSSACTRVRDSSVSYASGFVKW
jgi:AmmeMemoRadiSam system protein B